MPSIASPSASGSACCRSAPRPTLLTVRPPSLPLRPQALSLITSRAGRMGSGSSKRGPGDRRGMLLGSWSLRGLTPWSEAETDPDPEPYIRRRHGTIAEDVKYPAVKHEDLYDRPPPSSSAPLPTPTTPGGTALAAAPATEGAFWLLRGALGNVLLPALVGSAVGYSLGLGPLSVEMGFAAALGIAGRVLVRALAETVPFTGRRHHLLLPLPFELMMGEASFRKFLAEQKAAGKVMSRRSREHLLVAEVANNVIASAMKGYGGGSRGHMQRFKWEVVTVEDDSANAFVLPGGKVVVYTGLIRLLGGRRDLLATVLGHEVAHAMARHSAEKMTIGILAAISLRLLAAVASRAASEAQAGGGDDRGTAASKEAVARRRRQQQEQEERERYGNSNGGRYGTYDTTHATGPSAGWPTQPGGRRPQKQQAPLFFGGSGASGADDDYSLGPGSLVSQLLEGPGESAAAAAREFARHAAGATYARGGSGGLPQRLDASHPLMSPEVVSLLNNLLLQLPFSRRAESEADLIGLKLMALAGYDPAMAPETFKLLEAAEHGKRGGGLAAIASPVAKAASLGCTHPRSANRVRALQAEVRAMTEAGPQGYETVYTHPGYWSL